MSAYRPETIAALRERWSGSRGDSEAESILVSSNLDLKNGQVTVWCGRPSDAGKLLTRCGSKLTAHTERGDGISLTFDSTALRPGGISMAFKNIDSKGPPMTKEQKAAMRARQ